MSKGDHHKGADTVVLYAPAICRDCGATFRSDVAIAEPSWITPSYRATGGRCPRCGGRGGIPTWTYRFHADARQAHADATDQHRRDLASVLDQHLRQCLNTKETQRFIDQLPGPWKNVIQRLNPCPAAQRRTQLAFLRWLLDDAGTGLDAEAGGSCCAHVARPPGNVAPALSERTRNLPDTQHTPTLDDADH